MPAHGAPIVASLDRLHRWALAQPPLFAATPVIRLLLAFAFIPPGLGKVVGNRFTTLGVDTEVGYFFDAFFQASLYYGFVGAAQVTAAILLVIPRTSLMGAVLYFPIIVNIAFITNALPFGNTAIITNLMVLANLYLLCWDHDRLRGMLFPRANALPADHRAVLNAAGPSAQRFVWAAASGVAIVGLVGTVLTVTGPLQPFHARLTLLFAGLSVPVAVIGLWSVRRA